MRGRGGAQGSDSSTLSSECLGFVAGGVAEGPGSFTADGSH